jgi:phenylalanine-4-hydroxylase
MKTLFITPFIPCKLVLFFVIIFMSSCVNQETKYCDSIFKEEENNIESTIDFNLIDCLNESNKKTIHLATITFNQIKNLETLQLIFKIKNDHQKIDSELQKLTEKNLIIIPKLVYDFSVNPDSLKTKKSDFYLLNLLKTEIKNQILVFDKIEKKSQNTDFKIFAIKSKIIAQDNYDALQTILNNLKFI